MTLFARFASVCLFIGGAAAAEAQQPVTLTSTADFERGNNEGLVSPALDRVTRERITAGTVGAWSPSTPLPLPTTALASVAHDGFAYVIGGTPDGGSVLGDVLMAPIDGNGAIGGWSSTTSLPFARASHASVAYNGYVYVIGGTTDFSAALSDVLVAPINGDGTLGDWTPTTSLPDGRFYHSSFAFNGFLYAVGGTYDGSWGWYTDVVMATINADGTVGDWTSTSGFLGNRFYYSSCAHNGFLYILGGYDPDFNPLTDVQFAPLNEDGTVGSWSLTTALPSGRYFLSSAAHDGFLYSIGGYGDNGAMDAVLAAPLDADGEPGSWTATTPLPAGFTFLSALVHDGRVYTLGGFDANFSVAADVQGAAINPDDADANQVPALLRGAYSFLVDLGADTASRFITLNGDLASGGVIRLQVRVAPDATGIFAADTVVDPVILGSPIEVLGTGRYVWIRVTLDDTGASDVDDPTFVSDITTSASAPPTPGIVLDGPAADIDTQTSTSTIAANWSGFVAAPGDTIAGYEWSIGTAPGLTNVQGWVNLGLTTSASNSSLSLTNGVKYVNVRAVSALGLVSSPATSDGVQVQAAGTAAPAGGDGGHKSRCGQSASRTPGPALAMLAGLVLLASALGKRR
jgi:hypothetical protein